MQIEYKHDEVFRDGFHYANSPAAIRRFPFPFHEDQYMYSVNIEPHVAGPVGSVLEHPFDIDEHYIGECRERALVLEADPGRCQALPHMMAAQWDSLELMMTSLAASYPAQFGLRRDGARWHWHNRLLGIEQSFVFGDVQTLPYAPMEYIMRQVQGDWVLMDHRHDNLYMDAGVVTTQADWSLDFDLGMTFSEWHGPVPMVHEMGIIDRALKFLLNLQAGAPVRRLNWTMTVNPRLDTSPEQYPHWGADRSKVTADNAGELAHLRVELQTLFRLPRSHAIGFGVRCYLISMNELATVPKWAARMHRVLRSLPDELADYKGLTRYRGAVIDWLSRFDDGRPLSNGTAPE
ncbi:heme-dependent oxidative N-demethylase family protein [Imbroritus primus]|uniref:heme-dependent oxidative N-demethylase family protein n=1 Tax=Imbroritus primus TaxID=3058603 RepID=UPI003D16078D